MDEREAREILFETEYWKAVLTDTLAISERMENISNAIIELMLTAVGLLIEKPKISEQMTIMVEKVQDEIMESQANITGLIDLANGRMKALRERAFNGQEEAGSDD